MAERAAATPSPPPPCHRPPWLRAPATPPLGRGGGAPPAGTLWCSWHFRHLPPKKKSKLHTEESFLNLFLKENSVTKALISYNDL